MLQHEDLAWSALTAYETIVNLIASTTNTTGLIVRVSLDTQVYETGIQTTAEELAQLNTIPAGSHGN